VAPAPFGSSRKASSCAQRTHRWDGSTRLILAELILVIRLQPDQVLDSPRPSEVARRLGWVFVLVAFERLWNPVACLSFPRCHLSIGSAAIANAGQGSGLSQPECCVGQQDIAVVNQPLIHDSVIAGARSVPTVNSLIEFRFEVTVRRPCRSVW
jgi:hypothetical protein